MKNILNQINFLINQSRGNFINISENEYYFKRIKKYSVSEIELFEYENKIKLPQEYRSFLLEIGACELYFDEYQLGIEFHQLFHIQKITEEVFLGLDTPFPNLLLIASNLNNGYFIGYNLKINSNNCLSVYSIQEEYPENWANLNNFTSLGVLLEKIITSNGTNYFL